MKWVTSALLVLALGVGSVQAQEGTKPGKEHEFLAQMAGEWNLKFEGSNDAVGKAVFKMAHGGLWLTSAHEMKMPTGDFTGQGLDSYDPVKKKYISVWVDSMITSPILFEGDRSEDGKTITQTGKGPGADGKTTDYKSVTEYVNKDKHIFKLWSGNLTGDPMMTIIYERAK